MPGKYPTINSILTTRTSLTPGGSTGISNSDKLSLSTMFPNSPIYRYTESNYRTLAAGYLQLAFQTGSSDFPDGVDMNYTGAPDLSKITHIGGVEVDSPYYPNLIANSDPAGGEGTKTNIPLSSHDNFGTGAKVDNVLPSATSAAISAQTIDVFGPIAQPGDSGTHNINPGATGQQE
jgi:hypothetical protein